MSSSNEHGGNEDTKILHEMGYAQELSRRMGAFQSFAISFSIICIISGGFGSFPIAMSTGGPFSLTIGWLIGGVFALVVAASLGQIASAYPTAGSLYHWSSILGGRFWGWATAYVNLLGLLFVIPAINVFLYFITKDLFFGSMLGWDVSGWGTWTQIWSVVGLTAAQAALNHFGIRLTTILTDFAGYLILGVTLILIVMFFMAAPSVDFSKAFVFVNNTGAPGGNVSPQTGPLMAVIIGLLYPLFTITGFDASAHTAEETVDARNTVHKGMLHSVFWSLVFGFVLIISMIMAIPDTTASAASGWSSFNNLFIAAILPSFVGKLMLIGVLISNFLCALAAITSTSRMVFAFARDGGLPFSNALKSVSVAHRTPTAAIWTTWLLCSILTAITTPLGAFAALSTGCAMYLYISYAMPVVAGLFAEGKTWTTYGNFRLGGLSKLFAVIVGIGAVVVTIAGHTFVPSIAGDAAAGTSFVPGLWYYSVGFIIFLAIIWFVSENRRFQGPPMGDEIAKRKAAIAAAERAVGEAA
jgi:amino acid transporter